jgi:hypothetical protein
MGPSRPAFGSEARVPKRSALPCAFCYTSALTPHLKGTVVQGHRKESRLVSNVAQTDGCSSPEKCCYLSVAIKNRLDPILNGLVWNGNRLPQILLAPVNWRVPDLRFANYKIVERTAREELFLVLVFVVWLLQVAPCSTALLQVGTEHSPNCNTQAGLQERECQVRFRRSPKPAMVISGSELRTVCVDSMGSTSSLLGRHQVEGFRVISSNLFWRCRTGGLLIGFRNAGVAFLKNEKVTTYADASEWNKPSVLFPLK